MNRDEERRLLRFLLLLLILIALPGCSTRWQFPDGGTQQQFHADDYSCLRESRIGTNAFGGIYDQTLYKACMKARGYTQVGVW